MASKSVRQSGVEPGPGRQRGHQGQILASAGRSSVRTLYALLGGIAGLLLGSILAAAALSVWIVLQLLALNASSPWTATRILAVSPITLAGIALGAWLGARYGAKRPQTREERGRAVMFLVWAIVVLVGFVVFLTQQ